MTVKQDATLGTNLIGASDQNKSYNLKIGSKTYCIPYFNKTLHRLDHDRINIFASGPSIQQVNFDEKLLKCPTIFVNGSLILSCEYSFDKVVAYIISDARFIEHRTTFLQQSYKGQPLFITIDVMQAIAEKLPELVNNYYQNFTIIYPVNKPLNNRPKTNGLKKLFPNLKPKKLKLNDFVLHPDFVIDIHHSSKPIGVSLDITNGFVEAGTVAYIATQMAFSMGAKQIHLYGIDLINSDKPRFYESETTKAPNMLDKAVSNRIIPSFDLLALEYNKRDVKVFNHSPVSQHLFHNMSYIQDE